MNRTASNAAYRCHGLGDDVVTIVPKVCNPGPKTIAPVFT